jgi:hypothetical protein
MLSALSVLSTSAFTRAILAKLSSTWNAHKFVSVVVVVELPGATHLLQHPQMYADIVSCSPTVKIPGLYVEATGATVSAYLRQ